MTTGAFSVGKSSRNGNLGLMSNAVYFMATGSHSKRTNVNRGIAFMH